MIHVDVVIEDPRWEALDLNALAQKSIEAGAKLLDIAACEVSLLGCDDARVAALNKEFRGKAEPTNVLSWPSEDLSATIAGKHPSRPTISELGDIALSYETCLREAQECGKLVPDHVTHLVLHGFFHLLGYDHIKDEDAALMEGLEVQALETLGIQDPYKTAIC